MVRVGDVIERKYRIDRVLGEGGMGTVYEGVHQKIRRRVAIKVLKASASVDSSMVERFEREALAASAVRSKHVVEIFDVGQLESGEHYMIMEFLDGESLSLRLKHAGPMQPLELFPVIIQLLEGLAAAHEAGIVHRDLKPANVFIARGERGETVKVLDFGVSKFAQLSSEAFTQTGAIIGTPHYMAPEQTKGARHADHRSDLYAVGAVMFRALSGRPPFRAETIAEIIAKLLTAAAPPIASMVQVDIDTAAIVDKALAREPADRYQSAAEMAAALQHWLSTPHHEPAPLLSPPNASLASDDDEAPTEAWSSPSQDSSVTSARTLPTPAAPPAPLPFPSAPSAPTAPSSLHTPAPSTRGVDSIDADASAPARPRVGLVVAGAVAAVATVAVLAALLSGETSAPAVAPPETVAETVAETRGSPEAETPPPAPLVDGRSAASSVPSASGSAAPPATKTTAPPKPPPHQVQPAPRGRPKPAAPPSSERDFREDI